MTSKGKKRKQVGAATAHSEFRVPSSAPKKQGILVVDDKKENLVALRQILEGVDAEIVEATNGNEALAATLGRHFAVAILDVMMPGMDGYELARHLRGDEKTKVIPILFVTASYADELHMFEGYEAGGVDYIVKPVDPQVLLGKVRIFLEIDRNREELRRHRDQLEVLVAERTHALKERIKELKCLYAVSSLVAGPCESIDEALRTAVDLIPPGLQYPEIACAKITFEDREFATVGFRKTPWKLSADILIPSSGSRVPNSVLVCYLEERPELDEGPFYKEERNLVIDIARQLGVMIERNRAEERLRQNQAMLGRTEGIAHIGSWDWDVATDTVTWSEELFRIFQRDPGDGAPSFAEHPNFFNPQDMQRLKEAVEAAVSHGTSYELELRAIRKDGATRVCLARGRAEMGPENRAARLYGSLQDITERKKDEESLRAALEERGVMLREIHHRVKNNMQLISSLLRLQSHHVKDEKVLDILNASQNRIKSIALIHQKLYQSGDFTRVNFSDYITDVVIHLFATLRIDDGRIRYRVEATNIHLDIGRAIPCGLIVNELVANALKHAFPEGREGEILVRMRPSDGAGFELAVKDNGVGLPKGFDLGQEGGLGIQIVGDLAKQIDASIEIKGDAGTEIIIRW